MDFFFLTSAHFQLAFFNTLYIYDMCNLEHPFLVSHCRSHKKMKHYPAIWIYKIAEWIAKLP